MTATSAAVPTADASACSYGSTALDASRGEHSYRSGDGEVLV
ncbi:hypothetical protein ACIBG0_31160 [Nocardia sp. NPDC050630]